MFKVIIRNTRKKCEIYTKFNNKDTERRQWRRSSVFIVNLEYISLVFLLLTLNMYLFTGLDIQVSLNDFTISVLIILLVWNKAK